MMMMMITIFCPTGSDMDIVSWKYPGVWANFGEDVEALQSVHTENA